ncbi:Hef nuclease [Halobacteriales archaeon QS_4_62_28]|nr:MAG: Hef nuclease [Halobacteriales archaeon QS_4_62_28]
MAQSDAGTGPDYVERHLVTPGLLEQRRYQRELAEQALDDHTLVCLPTGLGKTTVSLLVTAERIGDAAWKSLLLAPTKPLVQQHAEFYREALQVPNDEIVVFTGDVRPAQRADLWTDARVVIATPQVVENDLVGNRISLSSVTHCTFDECHRATGDYAYNYIAERYHAEADDPLVTAMSASPGGDEEEIRTVCENLGLREVAVMTEDDADVAEYTHNTDVEWKRIELPETVIEIRDAINDVVNDRLTKLKELGVTSTTQPDVSEREIQKIQGQLQELMDNDQSEGYSGMSLLAEVRKLRTAVTYAETQSVEALRRYFERQTEAARSSGASKADQRLVSDPKVMEAMRKAKNYTDLHPKFRRTRMLLAETLGIENGERVIVFTESRDTAETLTDFLSDHFETEKFVGQSDTDGSDGMTQTQQQETLDRFRAGEFEVLVSTSVAEEGLDVPEVDLVLFYEPVPTAIRSIQRKGRTGRQTEGRVVVLLAEDTRDEAYFWKSRQDEKRMEDELRTLKNLAGELSSELGEQQAAVEDFQGERSGNETDETMSTGDSGDGTTATTGQSEGDGQAGLGAFAGENDDAEADDGDPDGATPEPHAEADDEVAIVADQRELDSTVARDLSTREGVRTELETLAVGDYVLSDRVVVERKTVSDFMDTLTGGDRSMFEQVGDATRHYARPVVVIEGENLYGERNVHHRAIQGALASLAVDFGASILRTNDEDETADLLETIARREQEESDREVSVHGEKQAKTLGEQQEYVVTSVAEVGPVTARAMLEHFGSVEAVMTADEDDLMAVEGVGEVTAERFRDVVGSEFEG